MEAAARATVTNVRAGCSGHVFVNVSALHLFQRDVKITAGQRIRRVQFSGDVSTISLNEKSHSKSFRNRRRNLLVNVYVEFRVKVLDGAQKHSQRHFGTFFLG